MQCLRCLAETAVKIASAPDGSGAWDMYHCEHCNYSWRTSEEEIVTVPEKRDPRFQLDKVDLKTLLNPVPIPPLAK